MTNSIEFELPTYNTERDCCKRCNSLKELWWFESDGKKFGNCCVMLLNENVVMKIENPETDMCEMFEEVQND